jgi:copper chaperone
MHHLHVPNMKCGGCLGAVTRAIQSVDSRAQVEGNLEARSIAVRTDKAAAPLLTALLEAGYPAEALPKEQ